MLPLYERKTMRPVGQGTQQQTILGLMASEGGQREDALVEHGCNYFGKNVIRSAPFAPFLRQDLLQLALDLKVPVPEIYGKIERKADGTLYTTGAQRTGCQMCGFGVHMEKRPHRFDKLRQRNPKEWEFGCTNVAQIQTRAKSTVGAVF